MIADGSPAFLVQFVADLVLLRLIDDTDGALEESPHRSVV